MSIRMARPTRRKGSSFLTFRKRVPKDILEKARGRTLAIVFPRDGADAEAMVVVRITPTLSFSLRTRDPSTAKLRDGIANTQIERMWNAVRSGPRSLTKKETVALAGALYAVFAEAFEDEPGEPGLWAQVRQMNGDAMSGEWANPLAILRTPQDRARSSLNARFGALVDAVLAREGLVVDQASRDALLVEAGRALNDVAKRLERSAKGDYTPDPAAARFPAWEGKSTKPPPGAVTLTSLHEGWRKSAEKRNLSRSTLRDYASRIKLFREWLKHDRADRVTPDTIAQYRDHRAEKVAIKTVNASDLAALKAVFGWAFDARKLPANPTAGVAPLKGARKVKERERTFTDAEVSAILSAARDYRATSDREAAWTTAARRWVPWLCAYSGARVGEIVQLRKQDISEVEGVPVMRITPEAATVKTGEPRMVPIHAHLIEEGFLAFVEKAKDGYLFLNAKDREAALRALPATKNRVREFVRTVFTDKRIAPNHSWRHSFKSRALDAEPPLNDRVVDAITGHAVKTVGDHYRTPSTKAKAGEMGRFPRYALLPPQAKSLERVQSQWE